MESGYNHARTVGDRDGGKMTWREAEKVLRGKGLELAADHIKRFENKNGRKGGWDADFASKFPEESKLIWPKGYHIPAGSIQ